MHTTFSWFVATGKNHSSPALARSSIVHVRTGSSTSVPRPHLACTDALSVEIYDIVMLVVLISATLFGAIKGFAWQLASIASIVISYLVAYHFREPFSQSIHAEPPWNRFLAMLILFVGTSLVIWVAFRMVSASIDRLRLREFDRHIGAVFGLLKGGLYCTLITLFAVTLLGDRIREKVVASKSGHYIAQILNRSESVIPPEIQEVVRPYLAKFDEKFRAASSTNPPPASDPVLPDAFWETATSVAGQVRTEVQNQLPTQLQNQFTPAPQPTPWMSGQSTPWTPSQSTAQPTAPYQQATQPSPPWTPYQR